MMTTWNGKRRWGNPVAGSPGTKGDGSGAQLTYLISPTSTEKKKLDGYTDQTERHGYETRSTDKNRTDNTGTRTRKRNGRDLRTTDECRKRCDSCGRDFKNDLGVKIHQGKSLGCKEKQERRSRGTPRRKPEENLSQESNHSTRDLDASATPRTREGQQHQDPPCVKCRLKLQLPARTDERWQQLDEDLDKILEANLRGSPKNKLECLQDII